VAPLRDHGYAARLTLTRTASAPAPGRPPALHASYSNTRPSAPAPRS